MVNLLYQGNTLFLWLVRTILLLQYNLEWVYQTTALTTIHCYYYNC